jgi:hypothetical protein
VTSFRNSILRSGFNNNNNNNNNEFKLEDGGTRPFSNLHQAYLNPQEQNRGKTRPNLP